MKTHTFAWAIALAIAMNVFAPLAHAATPVQFALDKTAYNVGDTPVYKIRSNKPFAKIYWGSTKNGVPTGENCSYYGQNTDARGGFSASGWPWGGNDIGSWVKYVNVDTCTNSLTSAAASYAFKVSVVTPLAFTFQPYLSGLCTKTKCNVSFSWTAPKNLNAFDFYLEEVNSGSGYVAVLNSYVPASSVCTYNQYTEGQTCSTTQVLPNWFKNTTYRVRITESYSRKTTVSNQTITVQR